METAGTMRGGTIAERLRSGLSWRRTCNQEKKAEGEEEKEEVEVVDGSGITQLVRNDDAFTTYVDHKFRELDLNGDGRLSVQELQPAVADIGAALGLPSPGSCPESDHIYSEVLGEFTQLGKKEYINKTEFKDVLSNILLGMAAGLDRNPIVILRLDGKYLKEYAESTALEAEGAATYSLLMESEKNMCLSKCIQMALGKLAVDHGMPPASDSWVADNVVKPALGSVSAPLLEQPASRETFLVELRKVVEGMAQRLKEHPVIVAHSEYTFDGSGIKTLLSNESELDKLLDARRTVLPEEHRHRYLSKDYLRIVLDEIAPSAGLPPYGAVQEIDGMMEEALRQLVDAGVGQVRPAGEEELRKMVREMFESIMLQLAGKTITVSSNSVVHEPLTSSSALTVPAATSISKEPRRE